MKCKAVLRDRIFPALLCSGKQDHLEQQLQESTVGTESGQRRKAKRRRMLWMREACLSHMGRVSMDIQLVAVQEAGKAKQRAGLLFLFNAVCLCFYFMYAEIH